MGFVVILEVDRTGDDDVKKKTPEQELEGLCKDIVKERNLWKHINEHGCNDPFWPDGCNLNLTRNHILYYRRKIEELCQTIGAVLPEEYFLPVPPEVDNHYMANLKQKERVKRLIITGNNLTRKKTKFVDDGQLEFL